MNGHTPAIESFIDRLDAAGLLMRVVQPVDTDFEIGGLARQQQEPPAGRRAVLFENIAGYPGSRLLANGCASQAHIALALGLDARTTRSGLITHIKKALRRPVAPRVGVAADAVATRRINPPDLAKLPVPWWHPLDGGRYLGTWHVNVSHDPATGIANAGVYRMQVIDSCSATISISPRSHLRRHIDCALQRNQELPLAVVIGAPEAVVMAGAAALPYGAGEFGFAGALLGAPIVLSPCETISCMVPADSQYVIEGHIVSSRRAVDGPFFDYAGVPSVNHHAYVYRVECIRHAPSPVFRGAAIGNPGAEDHELYSLLAACGCADFHGNRVRMVLQRTLFSLRAFRLLQWSGRIGRVLNSSEE
jgi:UbiD family decarboxylase